MFRILTQPHFPSLVTCTVNALKYGIGNHYHGAKKDLSRFEKRAIRYCKCGGKVTFTRPFLIFDKVTFDEHVNVPERYCKCDNTHSQNLMILFPKSKVIQYLILLRVFLGLLYSGNHGVQMRKEK